MFAWKNKSFALRSSLLLTLVTAIAWAIIVFPGLNMRDLEFASWSMIWPVFVRLFLFCSALGLVAGLFQYPALLIDAKVSVLWIPVSMLGYGIGIPAAFLLIAVLVSLRFPGVLVPGGGDFMLMSVPGVMVFGGAIAGAI